MKSFYEEYLKSPHWKSLRKKAFAFHGKKCLCCNNNKATQVHHLEYLDLYSVTVWELRPICETCHKAIHLFVRSLPPHLRFTADQKWEYCCHHVGRNTRKQRRKPEKKKKKQYLIKPMVVPGRPLVTFDPVPNIEDRLLEISNFFAKKKPNPPIA